MNNKISTFFLIIFLFLISCKKNDRKEIEKNKIETWNKRIQSKPQFLSFIFQPSLNENVEVNINFEKRYLTFKTIYPFISVPEPTKSREKNIEIKPSKPYYSELNEKQLKELTKILSEFKIEDYKPIEGTYIDGISYNFSILNSNKLFKVGNIANDATENQQKLILQILKLIENTNKFEENKTIINYYYKML